MFYNFFIMKQSKILSFSRFGFQTILRLSGGHGVSVIDVDITTISFHNATLLLAGNTS